MSKLPPIPRPSYVDTVVTQRPALRPVRKWMLVISLGIALIIVTGGLLAIIVLDTSSGEYLRDLFTTLSGTARLPKDFPGDVPVYPKCHLDSADQNRLSSNPKDFVVVFNSNDPIADIVSFYHSHLPPNGFAITQENGPHDECEIIAKKDDRVLACVIRGTPDCNILVINQIHVGSFFGTTSRP